MNLNPNGSGIKALALIAAGAALVNFSARGADRSWTGGTASYTNAANWTGGVVPGAVDNAINDNGTNNVVQINVGDPDWAVKQIRAGNAAGGAFEQNGQSLTLSGTPRALRLGLATNGLGAYTLNGGSINYGGGGIAVGEFGRATMNINGGSISGSGFFAVNLGTTISAVNATMDDGTTTLSGHTWFEQGWYANDLTRGLPPAGSTFTSYSQPDHSYTMAPSYAANNAVLIDTNVTAATLTLTSPTALSGLSFLGSSGNGTNDIGYTVHHADSTTETGTITMLDWFGAGTVAIQVGGRVRPDGSDIQIINDGPNFPYVYSVDIALANTASPVTSIDLAQSAGNGHAFLLAVSGSTGGNFNPLAITGYNADPVIEIGTVTYVTGNTNTLNQTAGTINTTGELWVGNYGGGVYNLSGGTNTLQNWTVIGRSSGNGVLNMSGGELNKIGNGDFLVGSGYQNIPGQTPSGVLNHSGGTINSQRPFLCPENSPAVGAYNLSGTAVLNLTDWFVIGRAGATGTFTMTGGTINKTGGGNFAIGENGGSVGIANHSAGTINVDGGEFFIGNNGGTATYNLSGTAAINQNSWMQVGRDGGNGTLNVTGGSITKTGGGVFIVGDNTTGYMSQSAGTVSVNEIWIGQGGGGNGTYDFSGTASLAVGGYVVIGRDGTAVMNMSGGTFTKTGGGSFIIASGNPANVGTLNQTGGDVFSTTSEAWVAEGGTAIWNLSGSATATLSVLRLGLNGGSSGTLNFNGGTMTVNEIAGGGGFATVNFNGATLVAGTNNANFIHDLDTADIGATTVIDTAAFNVTVNQSLTGSGGLTKNGAGTLTLNGANSYSGATTVNAGKVATTTASTGAGSFAVANGTTLGVQVAVDNGQLAAASVGFAGSASTLDMDLNTFGSPGAAPLSIAGELNVNGTVTLNVHASSALQIGVYPLITCSSRAGAGSFALGPLPLNTVATLVDGGTTISLNITDVNAPRWEGLAGGNWDIGLTTNWINAGSGMPTYFSEGSEVLFNDEALGTTSVNLVATVHPTSVTFFNTNLAYDLSGSGKISGATGLAKQGAGTLTIANTNDYTGATVISGGTVSVTKLANAGLPSPIGAGNLVLAGGTLSYAGPATTNNRSYSSTGGGIETLSDLTLSALANGSSGELQKKGPAQLTYTGVGSNSLSGYLVGGSRFRVADGSVLLDGSAGPQTNYVRNLSVGLTDGTNTTLRLTNTTLIVRNGFTVGDHNNATGTFIMNGSTLTHEGNGNNFAIGDNNGNPCTGVFVQNDGTVTTAGELWVGQTANGVGSYTLSAGNLTVNNYLAVGHGNGGHGTFTMTGGTLTKGNNGTAFIVGDGNGSVGTFNQSAGTLNCTREYWVGQGGGSLGTNNISGTAVVTVNDWTVAGRGGGSLGVINLSGGSFTTSGNGLFRVGDGGGSTGYVNVSGGSLTVNKRFAVADNGTGTLTQSGGTITVNDEFWIGQWHDGVGQFDISAGAFVVNNWFAVGREGAAGVLNITGGSITKQGNGNIPLCHGHEGNTASAVVNQSGGDFTCLAGELWIGEDTGTAVYNMNGGTASFGWVQLARNSSITSSELNLNAGTFAATEITAGGGTSTLSFNGGKLVARNGANANFLHGLTAANVLSGGAIIDSGTNVINVDQALLDGGGGLTKLGSGTLYLNGVNQYTGSTVVSNGTLGGMGGIAGSVTVVSGASLAPGASIGTLTVVGAVNLNAGSSTVMELNKATGTNDQLVVSGGLSYGGTLMLKNLAGQLAVNDTFTLFPTPGSGAFTVQSSTPGQTVTWDMSQLTVNGSVRVASVTAEPVSITSVASGGTLTLSWPASQTGWTLQTQTNPLGVGISTNWSTVAGSAATNQVTIPINPANPSTFYRLVF